MHYMRSIKKIADLNTVILQLSVETRSCLALLSLFLDCLAGYLVMHVCVLFLLVAIQETGHFN